MDFRDLLETKPFRWPKPGDLPLRPAAEPGGGAAFAVSRVARAVGVMDGFMSAGAALGERALSAGARREEFAYPMLFCYRHALEAGLKWLIAEYGPSLGIAVPRAGHCLRDLWVACEPMFEANGPDGDPQAVGAMAEIVEQFHHWDERGIAFRYAAELGGAVVAYPEPDIDIRNLIDVMDGVSNFLSGSDGFLASKARAKKELESDVAEGKPDEASPTDPQPQPFSKA